MNANQFLNIASQGDQLSKDQVNQLFKLHQNFPYFQTHYCSGNRRWENLSRSDLRLLFDFQQGKWEEEWRNQFHKVYAKGRLSQRRPIGPWQFFVYDGHLSESGFYQNGKKEGDWYTFYHQFTVCYELNLPPVGRNCDLSQIITPHPAGWVSSVTPYKNGKIYIVEGKTSQNEEITITMINYTDRVVLEKIEKR